MDWGSTAPHSREAIPGDIWARAGLWSVRRGNPETGHDWQGGWGFPYKAGRSCFLG